MEAAGKHPRIVARRAMNAKCFAIVLSANTAPDQSLQIFFKT